MKSAWVKIMADYIDKQKTMTVIFEIAENVIKSLPSADVVEVVRCKDCIYWQDNNDGYPHEECRWGHDETPNEDDYCSYGERKE